MRKLVAIQNWKKARTYVSKLLADIPENRWLDIPENNYSNLLWQYGHILASEYRLALLRVRGSLESDSAIIPANFIPLFAKGSQGSASTGYTVAQIKSIGDAISSVIEKESTNWSDEFLDQKAEGDPHPMFQTRIEALEYAAFHDFLHCGQIGILRRQLGFPSLG